MLVVKLEVHPGGDASRAREIGRATISNLSDLAPTSDYEAVIESTSDRFDGRWKKKRVVFGHERDRGAWWLLFRALAEVFR